MRNCVWYTLLGLATSEILTLFVVSKGFLSHSLKVDNTKMPWVDNKNWVAGVSHWKMKAVLSR
jgi:hypothetical protein